MWRLLNEEYNDNSTSIPTKILIGEKYITSPKEISEKMNKHLIDKVETLSKEFVEPKMNPISILQKLIKRNENQLKIHPISRARISKIISKMKPSNTRGYDQLNS